MHRQVAMMAAALVALAGAAGGMGGCSDNDDSRSSSDTGGRTETARGGSNTGGSKNVAAQDREFVRKAAIGGMYEVETGRLASRRGGDAEVKRIGQMLVEDHQAANSDLKRVARNRGIDVPASLDSAHREKADRLRTLEGSEFDREFLIQHVESHRMAIQEFERASRECQDADVRAFAARTLPTLREHGGMIESTASKMGVQVMGSGMGNDMNRMGDAAQTEADRMRNDARDSMQRETDRYQQNNPR